MALEELYEQVIKNFPNLIHSGLRKMPVGQLGETNVCLQQAVLAEAGTRLDLAFVTDEEIHLVELKRDVIDEETLHQLTGYMTLITRWYPHHKLFGYMVGRTCKGRSRLTSLIGDRCIKIVQFGRDIPTPRSLVGCPFCGAGVALDPFEREFPCCGEPRSR